MTAKLITLELKKEHASTGHVPGCHAALVMPLYPCTVAKLLKVPPKVVLAQGKRMQQALVYMHSKNYVHMDVKVGKSVIYVCHVASHDACPSCGLKFKAMPGLLPPRRLTTCLWTFRGCGGSGTLVLR